MSATSPPSDPQRFGPFTLHERLGKGGMAEVFRATLPDFPRPLALKLPPAAIALKPLSLERFHREGQLTAQLRHPHIVPVHSAGDVDGRPYLAYALIEEARTLDRALPHLSTARALDLLTDVARALGYAHRRGIVHRDVKPQNVLITADERALVADFGLATHPELDRLTRTHEVPGTPSYLAPERLRGDHASPASDVFALGALLFRVLTHTDPFRGFAALSLTAPPSPRALDPTIPLPLDALCRRALHPDPDQRPPHGDAFADLLHAARTAPTTRTTRARALLLLLLLPLAALLPSTPTPSTPDPSAPDVAVPDLDPHTTARRVAVARATRALRDDPDLDTLRACLQALARTRLHADPDHERHLAPLLATILRQRDPDPDLEWLSHTGLTLDPRPLVPWLDRRWSQHLLQHTPDAQYLDTLRLAVRLDVPLDYEHVASLRDLDLRATPVDRYLELRIHLSHSAGPLELTGRAVAPPDTLFERRLRALAGLCADPPLGPRTRARGLAEAARHLPATDALPLLRASLDLVPDDPLTRLHLAWANLEARRPPHLDPLEQAFRDDPRLTRPAFGISHAHLSLNLAHAHLSLADPERARQLLHRAEADITTHGTYGLQPSLERLRDTLAEQD